MIEILGIVWNFLKTPLGGYVVAGVLAVVALFSFGAYERHAQAAKDAPWITNPVTHRKWKDEATAATRDLGTCTESLSTTMSSLDTQNQAVEALKASDAQRAAAIASARQAAQKSAARAQSAADQLAGYKAKGGDACSRLLDADAKVKELTR